MKYSSKLEILCSSCCQTELNNTPIIFCKNINHDQIYQAHLANDWCLIIDPWSPGLLYEYEVEQQRQIELKKQIQLEKQIQQEKRRVFLLSIVKTVQNKIRFINPIKKGDFLIILGTTLGGIAFLFAPLFLPNRGGAQVFSHIRSSSVEARVFSHVRSSSVEADSTLRYEQPMPYSQFAMIGEQLHGNPNKLVISGVRTPSARRKFTSQVVCEGGRSLTTTPATSQDPHFGEEQDSTNNFNAFLDQKPVVASNFSPQESPVSQDQPEPKPEPNPGETASIQNTPEQFHQPNPGRRKRAGTAFIDISPKGEVVNVHLKPHTQQVSKPNGSKTKEPKAQPVFEPKGSKAKEPKPYLFSDDFSGEINREKVKKLFLDIKETGNVPRFEVDAMINRKIPPLQEKQPGLYMIVCNVDGSTYYGQSSNVLRRLDQHASDLRLKQHHNTALQDAWNKYSSNKEKAFEFVCLDFGKKWVNVHTRRQMEVKYLQRRDRERIFNVQCNYNPQKSTSFEGESKYKPTPIVFNGTFYVSIDQAAQESGFTRKAIVYLCRSKHKDFSNCYIKVED